MKPAPVSHVPLWGDIFVTVAAFEEIYAVDLRYRFAGVDGQTYAGKGFVTLDVMEWEEGYTHHLLGAKSTYYDMLEGRQMDEIMYELLIAIEPLLQHITEPNGTRWPL